jgi:hypothetical protein
MQLPSLSSVMDLFKTAPQQNMNQQGLNGQNNQQTQVPGGQSTGNGLPNTQQTAQTEANGVIPVGQTKKLDPNDPQSLLEQHSKVWETPAIDPKTAPKDIFEGFDPAKVMEATGKVDFSKVLTPDLLAKVNAGGAEATTALAQVLTQLGQNTLGRSTITTKTIVEEALKAQRVEFEKALPGLVKQAQVTSNLAVENPLLQHPALKPVVSALQQQISANNPEATTAQIQEAINGYLSTLGQVFAPKPEPSKESAREKNYDFSSFLPKS